MGLHVEQIAVGGFDDNFSYVIVDEDSQQAAIVDPSGDIQKVFSYVEQHDLSVVQILVTHSHFDHVDRLGECLAQYSVPVYMHTNACSRIEADDTYKCCIEDKHTIPLGDASIQVVFTPGHTEDSVCFLLSREQNSDHVPKLITGDTLFVEGCGRTSEPLVRDLYQSLQTLKQLEEDTQVYPGHDYGSIPISTIKHEKERNKYFLAQDFEEFRKIRLG